MNIDYEKLREDLVDYFGSAIGIFSVAIMDVIKVENATHDELLEIAKQNKFDLSNYETKILNYKC